MSEASRKRWLLLMLALFLLLIYLLVPSIRAWVNKVFGMFISGDFDAVQVFIKSYGGWAAAISFLLMVFAAIIAPLPQFLITLTNANLFGWWQGAILSWTSSMVGAALCFYIARILGRDVAIRFTTKAGLEHVERFFERYGKYTILICRLLPFLSFDIVSYAAGLTAMSFGGFFLATGIGQLPATIIYSYVGGLLTGGAKKLFMGLVVLFAASILVGIMGKLYNDRRKKKEALK